MSLEGSLKTVPLPEVLHLLADTSKSGELYVAGPGTGGRFWFGDGRYTGFEVGRCDQAVDALFELLRLGEGDFVFDAGVVPPQSAPRGDGDGDIRPVLKEAEARLLEWKEIVAVVPSLAHTVVLVTDPGRDEVQLDRDQWAMVVAVGEGRSVQSVLDARGLPEFDGCKAVKGLVDAGLVTVGDPVEAPAAAARVHEVEVEATEPVAAVEGDGEVEDTHEDAGELDDADESEDADGAPEAPAGPGFQASARDALSALIEGIANDPDASYEPEFEDEDAEPALIATANTVSSDGLADRGPWTSSELASLDHMPGWADTDHADDDPVADDEDSPDPEPINRGLLLKFLSSVRS